MSISFRCNCPITSALDILGDKWSLTIIKQMLFEDKSTFKDFSESDEAIATNILSARLKMLEQLGIIEKQKLPSNKKTNIYTLTDKGVALTPVLMELSLWSKQHIGELNPTLNLDERLDWVEKNKEMAFTIIAEKYQEHKKSLLKTEPIK